MHGNTGLKEDCQIELSIVTTLYNSERYIEEFNERISKSARELEVSYEIIYVNDGSPDCSVHAVKQLKVSREEISLVNLSRNFGHHQAMLAGLRHARGKYVFLIDVDLEEPPELLIDCWRKLLDTPNADVVYGESEKKTQPFAKKCLSKLFYFIFNMFTSFNLSGRELVARLMTRRYVNALTQYRESEIFMPAIWLHAGFEQHSVVAKKGFTGNTSYSLRRRLSLAIEAITSFSSKPLVFVFYLGAMISFFAMCVVAYTLTAALFFDEMLSGWSSIMMSIYLMGGLILLSLGIIGIYLAKVYTEVKSRPPVIIKELLTGASDSE